MKSNSLFLYNLKINNGENMKKEYRLLKNEDFKKILDNHKCVSRENFTIYHRNNNLEHCRVGVSVSSKIGNSVVRHKIKRQIVSMLDNYVNVDWPIDLIVIVRKKYLDYSFYDNDCILSKVIKEILKKEKIKNEK